ncbi:response regulator [Nocardioides sambongensis]|uniref:response regulator n=1 Tax=Nocardioides sambongensis TaxID=2589074 RepID=UPI001E2D6A35|nr:response regulator [Nocardioides sambongensis]
MTGAQRRVWRVLVVDDDFMVARIHARFVERTAGFEVAGTAHTGADALARIGAEEPDVVLLDVHLPDLSGLEVLARLRSAGSRAAVVMVTAERGAEAVRAALHGGAQQYLVKPFDHADLADRLQRVGTVLASLAEAGADTDEAEVDQATIDRAFGGVGPPVVVPARLPKGLSPETAELVLAELRVAGEASASEVADTVGMARVTARRYLEHFVDAGAAVVRLQYGSTGRPERRYRTGGAADGAVRGPG